jgi:hypothetical protein
MSDFTSYQSAETEWRYYSQLSRANDALEKALDDVRKAEAWIARLEARPPLTHLFNWSA